MRHHHIDFGLLIQKNIFDVLTHLSYLNSLKDRADIFIIYGVLPQRAPLLPNGQDQIGQDEDCHELLPGVISVALNLQNQERSNNGG